jgi:hypothetical protein
MAVEVQDLYIEGCPNHSVAVGRVREALSEEGVVASVSEVSVPDQAQARQLKFLGSPSIRVNGLDVEPSARSSHDYALACRTYVAGDLREGAPSLEMIRVAVLEACAGVRREQHQEKEIGEDIC